MHGLLLQDSSVSAVSKNSAVPALPPAKKRELLVMSSDKDSRDKSQGLDRGDDTVWTPEKVDTRLPVYQAGFKSPLLAKSMQAYVQAKPAGLNEAKQRKAVALSPLPKPSGCLAPCAILSAIALYPQARNICTVTRTLLSRYSSRLQGKRSRFFAEHASDKPAGSSQCYQERSCI